MLTTLTHSILPVFAILALGFVMGRLGQTSENDARAANRVAFLTMQPALIFSLMAAVDFAAFDVVAIVIYAASEGIVFTVSFAIARHLFGRGVRESILLGMATIFVNSLLYIWPISFLIYGETAALPITAIVAFDASISFAAFIIAMEVLSEDGGGPKAGALRILRNPVILAIVIGTAINLFGWDVPAPVMTFMDFAGRAAAPLTLFALGVILSQIALMPGPVDTAIIAIKLLAFPALVWAGLASLSPGNPWAGMFLLNAAGPSGAMAFAMALLYGVRSDAIARVIIWTSALSLISLAYLA